MQLNPLHKKKEGFRAFFIVSFLITKSLNIDISGKKRLCSTVDLFSVVRVVLYVQYTQNIQGYIKYTIYTFFHFSRGRGEEI